MHSRIFVDGLIILGAGLFASSVSSFLGHFPLLGTATTFAIGIFDGLSVIAFCVATIVMVRSKGAT